MTTSRRRAGVELLLLLAVTALAVTLVHSDLVLHGKIYSSTDAESAEAFRTLGEVSRQQGEYPLWNPFVFAGMPSFASLAYTPNVYPLQLPLEWLTTHLHLVPMTWLLAHLLLAGFSTAAYARWRGMSLAAAGAAGALVVALSQVTAWSAYGHGTKVGTFAWLPLTLWCLEGVLRRGRWLFVFGLAAAAGMQLLRAHVQILYYTVLAGGLWAGMLIAPMLRDRTQRAVALRRAGMVGVAAVLAIAAALVLYLPVWGYQSQSIRGAASQGGGTTYEYATAWSLPLREMATFWWPTAAGYGRASYAGGMPFTDYPNYMGAPLLLLALLAVICRRDRWAAWLAIVAVLSTLVALGRHGPLYGLLYHLAPGFKKFRVPVMILILQQYALVLLATAGIDQLLARLSPAGAVRPRWLGRPAVVILGLAGVVLLSMGTVGAGALRNNSIAGWLRLRPDLPAAVLPATAQLATADATRLGLLMLAGCATAVAVARRKVAPAAGAGVLGLMLFVDFLAVGRPIVHPERALTSPSQQGSRVIAVPSPPVVRDLSAMRQAVAGTPLSRWLLQQQSRPRVWPLGRLAADNALAAQQIVSLGGYHPAKLKVYEDVRARLYDRSHPEVRLANLLAAQWAVLDGPLPADAFPALASLGMQLDESPAYAGADGVAYRIRSAQPRAWLVDRYQLEGPPGQAPSPEPAPGVLDRVLAPGFDPRTTAILSRAPQPAPAAGGAAGTATVVAETFHRMELSVTAPQPAVVVVADIYYPGWKAAVDGTATPILRADHALRAVAVPAGEHRLTFRFQDESFTRGRTVSLVAGAVIVLGLIASAWFERRRGGQIA